MYLIHETNIDSLIKILKDGELKASYRTEVINFKKIDIIIHYCL